MKALRRNTGIMALLGLLGLMAGCAAGPNPGQVQTREGMQLLQAGQYPEAAAAFQQVVDAGEASGAVWYHLGLARAGAGEKAPAAVAYREAARLDPELADAWANLGYLLLELDRLDEAAEAFQNLDRLEPGSAEPVGMLAQIELGRGEPEGALQHLRQALERDPTQEKLRLQAAALLAESEQSAEARDLLEAAPEPRSVSLQQELLRICVILQEVPCVQSAWSSLATRGTPEPALGTAAAILLREQGETESARAILEQLVSGGPAHGPALHLLGLMEHQADREVRAEELYRQARKADPEYAPALYDLGRLLAGSGRTEEALSAFDAVLALQPDHLDACGQKGMALAEAGRMEEALPYLKRFVADAPEEYAAFVEQMKAWIQKAEAGGR